MLKSLLKSEFFLKTLEEGLKDIRVKAAHACRRALLGQPFRNVVN